MKTSKNLKECAKPVEVNEHRLEPIDLTAIDLRDYRHFLKEELEVRKANNERYSLRAFARDLGMSPAFLVSIMKGTKNISEEKAEAVANRLKWTAARKKAFQILVRYSRLETETLKEKALHELTTIKAKDLRPWQMNLEKFRVVADWYHSAVLECFELEKVKSAKVISQNLVKLFAAKLDLPQTMIQRSLDQLANLGFIKRSGSEFVKSQDHYSIEDIPSGAIKEHHRQILQKAERALQEQDLFEREFSATTMAIPEALIPEIKVKIRQFRQEIEGAVAAEANKSEIYTLSMQFFRISKEEL